jgi:rhodanese-related sulfurtransferase
MDIIIILVLSVEKARELLKEGVPLVDVRTETEYESKNIRKAMNIPLYMLEQKVPEILPDRNKTILLHCRSGSRSFAAKRKLKGMGYANVFNLGSFGRAKKIAERGMFIAFLIFFDSYSVSVRTSTSGTPSLSSSRAFSTERFSLCDIEIMALIIAAVSFFSGISSINVLSILSTSRGNRRR